MDVCGLVSGVDWYITLLFVVITGCGFVWVGGVVGFLVLVGVSVGFGVSVCDVWWEDLVAGFGFGCGVF